MKQIKNENDRGIGQEFMENKEERDLFDSDLPAARIIKIDPTVSLLMMSTPPGNPGGPFSPPDWGNPWR